MSSRNVLFATLLASILSGAALIAFASHGAAQRRPSPAPIPNDAPARPENGTACNYQEPIDYLVRENFVVKWRQPAEEQAVRRARHEQAIRWRTENYGYFEGFGQSSWNRSTPSDNAVRARFMGLPIRINEKIVPALACVEEQIRAECGETYRPGRLSGLRTSNTYHNGEVSNHVYGIAVDVDPTLNTCCMCVAQWGDHPLCQREVESIYERMAMPSCWVHVFERFGFYWLGRDALQDTMHFEFLGDPDHILKSQGPPPARTAEGTPAAATP
ncbi:MAG: M15 family metallopeptidase [Sandaracinus sp.]|nr:M15 family metallopeptidase [Sandaracinus sp.]MCB9618782.1 M15 family metallopeptidase [Sandaracinus sp.]